MGSFRRKPMTKKRRAKKIEQGPADLVVLRADAEAKIEERIALGKDILSRPLNSWDELKAAKQDYYKWSDYNTELLKRLFTNASLADEYSQSIGFVVAGGPSSLREDVHDFRDDVSTKVRRLESIKDRLELMADSAQEPASTKPAAAQREAREKGKIFVVHGHDEGVRESVARFLDKMGFEPIILHEQGSGGRTIIEKLEHYSDVDYAVVLLTPDDVGAKASDQKDFTPRARQNVILELGYFIGRLGRQNVCALHKGGLDLPSDFLGVVYVPYDGAGAWKVLLAKELKGAGFPVDLNEAL
jgi:predicted nucleotide-binding protein